MPTQPPNRASNPTRADQLATLHIAPGVQLETVQASAEQNPHTRRGVVVCYLSPFVDADGLRYDKGVYYHGINKDGDEVTEQLASPIRVVGQFIDPQGKGGFIFEVHRQDIDRTDTLTLYAGELTNTRQEWETALLNARATINYKRGDPESTRRLKSALLDYLNGQHEKTPPPVVQLVERTGYTDDGRYFVLPSCELTGDPVQLLNPHGQEYESRGELDQWRQHIGRYCEDNPLILLAVLCALSGVLLRPLNTTGAILHLYGKTGKGKTTLLNVCASVWGHGERYAKQWRATANGIEQQALLHNDTALILDEMASEDARTVKRMIYQLANGTPKARAKPKREGGITYDAPKPWRLLTVSTGEQSASDFLSLSGAPLKAGESVRLLDIHATGRAYGVFDTLHGFTTPQALAEHLRGASVEHYGTAGRHFVDFVTSQERRSFGAQLSLQFTQWRNVLGAQIGHASGEELRALKIFAALAVTGEIAQRAQILPHITKEQIAQTVLLAFNQWRDGRGVTGQEVEHYQLAQALFTATTLYPDRFAPANGSAYGGLGFGGYTPLAERLGFIAKAQDGQRIEELYFLGDQISATLKTQGIQWGKRKALEHLQEMGLLVTEESRGQQGRKTARRTVDGKRIAFYVVDYRKLLQWLAKANGEQDGEQDSTAPAPVYSLQQTNQKRTAEYYNNRGITDYTPDPTPFNPRAV